MGLAVLALVAGAVAGVTAVMLGVYIFRRND